MVVSVCVWGGGVVRSVARCVLRGWDGGGKRRREVVFLAEKDFASTSAWRHWCQIADNLPRFRGRGVWCVVWG